jgi:hypothetical protein
MTKSKQVVKRKKKALAVKPHGRTRLPTGELVRFLRRLALTYRDPVIGNELLSSALDELATSLGKQSVSFAPNKRPPTHVSSHTPVFTKYGSLHDMDAQKIEQLLKSPTITKLELIQLAGERFSIPKAKLTKLTLEGVRQAIGAALSNEESLKIISREAWRGGSNRSS